MVKGFNMRLPSRQFTLYRQMLTEETGRLLLDRVRHRLFHGLSWFSAATRFRGGDEDREPYSRTRPR